MEQIETKIYEYIYICVLLKSYPEGSEMVGVVCFFVLFKCMANQARCPFSTMTSLRMKN